MAKGLVQIDFRDGFNKTARFATAGATQGFLQALERFPHVRSGIGVTDRNGQIMSWRLPNGSSVKMYINPENFVVRESKQISNVRTKGGFVIQYWGENLTELTLSGTTGSSGIKGINLLRDIYRSENRGFDLVTAQLLNDIRRVQGGIATTQNLNEALTEISNRIQERKFLLRPTLASLATSVLLFYQGVQYKGYFTEFTVTEGINKLGLFDYNLRFMSTETRGVRKNFMPWHKEPLADDPAGQLINGIGNLVRGAFGLGAENPEAFHPSTAPLTFGGNSLAAGLGFASEPLSENPNLIT